MAAVTRSAPFRQHETASSPASNALRAAGSLARRSRYVNAQTQYRHYNDNYMRRLGGGRRESESQRLAVTIMAMALSSICPLAMLRHARPAVNAAAAGFLRRLFVASEYRRRARIGMGMSYCRPKRYIFGRGKCNIGIISRNWRNRALMTSPAK